MKINSRIMIAGVFAIAIAAWSAARLNAFNPQPDPPGITFTFGVDRLATARLSYALVPPDPYHGVVPPDPCRADFRLYDGEGKLLKQQVMSIRQGTTGWIDVSGLEAGGRESMRAQLHGEVVPLNYACHGQMSAEVFDTNSARTLFLVPAVQDGDFVPSTAAGARR